jgi:hypothetical protein
MAKQQGASSAKAKAKKRIVKVECRRKSVFERYFQQLDCYFH